METATVPAEMGGGPGAVVTVGGKKLVFEPETIEATAQKLDQVRLILSRFQLKTVEDFTGQPAAADIVSAFSTTNLRWSAQSALAQIAAMSAEVEAAAANLRANGSDYGATDGSATAVST